MNVLKACAIALAAVSTSAVAAEWQKYYADHGSDAYYDASSVKRIGKQFKVWVLYDFNEPMNISGMAVSSMKQQVAIDCENDRYRQLYVAGYDDNMGRGALLATHSADNSVWAPPIPESPAENLNRKVCKLAK